MEPDKYTLTGFTAKAKAEIDANRFAATTGGLVNMTAQSFWELFYGATAWHRFLAERALPEGDGPHDGALLETDGSLVVQARAARALLIERARAEGDDSLAHSAHCYKLPAAIASFLHGLDQAIAYHEAQDGLIEKAQQEAARLGAELAEVKRPLSEQMERLNNRVIELTAELDRHRMADARKEVQSEMRAAGAPPEAVAAVEEAGRADRSSDS